MSDGMQNGVEEFVRRGGLRALFEDMTEEQRDAIIMGSEEDHPFIDPAGVLSQHCNTLTPHAREMSNLQILVPPCYAMVRLQIDSHIHVGYVKRKIERQPLARSKCNDT